MELLIRLPALMLTLLFLAAACTSQNAFAPKEVPFEAGAYPVDGPAACELDESGKPMTGLARINAVDERTVIFELCATDPTFLQKLTIVSYGINDSGYLAAATADGSILTAPNGTGPLKLISWSKEQEEVIVGRFDEYWGDKAKSDRIIFKWQGDSAARMLQLEAGLVDGIDNLSADDIARFSSNPAYTILKRPPVNTLYLGMNTAFPPFDDIRVRQAIAMTIDSERIVSNFFPAGSAAATHYVPCIVKFGCVGKTWWPKDLDRARALLAEAGFPDGFKTAFVYRDSVRASNPDPNGIAIDIQSQLAEIGIEVTLEVQDSTTFDSNVLGGLVKGMFVRGWTPDYLDPINYMFRTIVGDYKKFGDAPFTQVSSPLYAATTMKNSQLREAAFTEANDALRELAFMIPLGHASSAIAWAANVNGAHSSPISDENFSSVSVDGREQLVFVQSVEPGSLYCADETDNSNLRMCSQVNERLYAIERGGTEPVPSLATSCEPNDTLTVWTCTLRDGVIFHNGARFDAGDVRDSYAAQWDCANPTHVGRSGLFRYWSFMSSFLNEDQCSVPE